MEKYIDLHLHTTASDGTETPEKTAKLAAELGLAAIAVTDHDTVDGISEAKQAGERLGLEVIAGIEISTDYNWNKVHVLGLFIDPADPGLRPVLEWAVSERESRNMIMVRSMAEDGFDISIEVLNELYPDSVLGRPHMAEYLMKKGYVSTVKEAFVKYLGEGCPYYRPKTRMPMKIAIGIIRQAGGLPIIAHPLQYGFSDDDRERLIADGKKWGCAGLEAYYSEHSAAQQRLMLDTAARYGLAVSGGSDWHGTRKPHIRMGSGIDGGLAVPYSVLEELKKLC